MVGGRPHRYMASGWGSHNPAQARVIAGETLTRVEAEHQVRLLVLLRPRLAAMGAALAGLALVLGGTVSAGADPGTILKFDTMTPVTGPYVGSANPVRAVPGGGLPWMITAGTGSLKSDGHLLVHVRGLVLADQSPVPPAQQGINPIPDFRAIVSCQSISAGGTATISNVSTAQFPASTAGNSDINATVSLPRPCIAPVVFVTSPGGAWFAATGS
jgi:hypothetical protein